MLSVGIIGNFKETKYILNNIFKQKEEDLSIFEISKKTIEENLTKNLCPKILIINKLPKINNITEIIAPKNCIVLLNIDQENNDFAITTSYLITYGINQKATITFSGVEKNIDRLQFCIQRNIKSMSGNIIYEQEFPVYYKFNNIPIILASVTVGLLNDISFLK